MKRDEEIERNRVEGRGRPTKRRCTQGARKEDADGTEGAQASVTEGSGADAAAAAPTEEKGTSQATHEQAQGDASDSITSTPSKAGERPSRPRGPARRRGGMSSLSLTQRRCTGGRGVGGHAGEAAFRRRALSTFFGDGIATVPLRLGRVAGSRTGAGVVRGRPEGSEMSRRGAACVTCMEFDSMGALLAVGGMDSLSVYDFDEFCPKVRALPQELVPVSREGCRQGYVGV